MCQFDLGGAGGHNGYENPNYHGSSNTFHTNPAFQVVEAYELDTISGGGANGEIPVAEKVEQAKVEAPYYYQVSTPNYMLLIGGDIFILLNVGLDALWSKF